MSHPIFADRIGTIGLAKGMVRIELLTEHFTSSQEGGEAKSVTQSTVILTPQGYLQALESMQEFTKKLKEAGVIVDRQVERRQGAAVNAPEITKPVDETKSGQTKGGKQKTPKIGG